MFLGFLFITKNIWNLGCFHLSFFSVDRRRRRRGFVQPNFEERWMPSTMIEDLEELDYMGEREGRDVGGREWRVLCWGFCENSHFFSIFWMKLHLFMCYVENTPFHILLKTHLFIFYEHNICTFKYIYVYIKIGTYVPSEGSEYPSEIFGRFFGRFFGTIFLWQNK